MERVQLSIDVCVLSSQFLWLVGWGAQSDLSNCATKGRSDWHVIDLYGLCCLHVECVNLLSTFIHLQACVSYYLHATLWHFICSRPNSAYRHSFLSFVLVWAELILALMSGSIICFKTLSSHEMFNINVHVYIVIINISPTLQRFKTSHSVSLQIWIIRWLSFYANTHLSPPCCVLWGVSDDLWCINISTIFFYICDYLLSNV